MSDFFKNYSTFYYNMDKVKPIRGKLATNLLSRVNITNEVLKNVRSYYPYRIKEHERPDIIAQEYFTFTYFNEPLIKNAYEQIQEKKINLNVNLFKKQNNFSITQSINHNLILLLLYENIKSKKVFKYYNKLKKTEKNDSKSRPSLNIDNLEITQDDLNSLFEFDKIESLLNKLDRTNGRFLEIGAGAGRTAKTILSIKDTWICKHLDINK